MVAWPSGLTEARRVASVSEMWSAAVLVIRGPVVSKLWSEPVAVPPGWAFEATMRVW